MAELRVAGMADTRAPLQRGSRMGCGRLSCLSLAVETDLAWQEGPQGHMAEVIDMDLKALSTLMGACACLAHYC